MLEVGIFAAKAAIIVLSFAVVIVLIAVLATKAKHKPELEVEPRHEQLKRIGLFLKSYTLTKEELKVEKKREKKKEKEKNKDKHKDKHLSETPKKKIFVLNFTGDIKASQTENLREEITSVLQLATPNDEVVVKVESPGGVVHGYGLAASQLLRVRHKKIPLTICVDKIAASGGYMMACVANRIIAAPFAILGSVGVVAQVPNFNRLLKKHDVDYKEYTAGEYKRTVSVLGEITPKGEQKFLEQLEDTHELFKKFVSTNRPQVNLEQIATGEYWFGERAKELGLIDEILTSDDYLLQAFQAETPIYEIKYEQKHPFSEKLSNLMGQTTYQAVVKVLQHFETQRFF